DFQFAF
ncbi:hypothetical protein D046_7950B, partial [Vibrio parahaemolyticus V-223/04]